MSTSLPSDEPSNQLLVRFCQQHQLPDSYLELADTYFLPLADSLAEKAQTHEKTLLIGINGCQGSGKSTMTALLTDYLQTVKGLKVSNLSIDDFYLTRLERGTLAQDIHPLLATRGVPGTHDMVLLDSTLKSLMSSSSTTRIPRFNKATDDRHTEDQWDTFTGPADIILLEGWCIGVSPESETALEEPINDLEQTHDPEGLWRKHVNHSIKQGYQPLFDQLDQLIMLEAPSFECVYQWRRDQEEKLRLKVSSDADTSGLMDDNQLKFFISHYQRLTQHMLVTLPKRASTLFTLDINHRITARKNNG